MAGIMQPQQGVGVKHLAIRWHRDYSINTYVTAANTARWYGWKAARWKRKHTHTLGAWPLANAWALKMPLGPENNLDIEKISSWYEHNFPRQLKIIKRYCRGKKPRNPMSLWQFVLLLLRLLLKCTFFFCKSAECDKFTGVKKNSTCMQSWLFDIKTLIGLIPNFLWFTRAL